MYEAPPLSLVNSTKVLSATRFWSSASRIRPITASVCITKSP